MRSWPLVLVVALSHGCIVGDAEDEDLGADEDGDQVGSLAAIIGKQSVVDTIRSVAAARGITNSMLIAGIANGETGLAHCRADYIQQICKQSVGTPTSPSCGGGSVLVGNADPSCDQGGLGLFQIDYGTQKQTIAHYGAKVLALNGNVEIGIEHILNDLRLCSLTPSFGSDATVARQKAIAWLNNATRGSAAYNTFMMCMSRHYNGAGTQAQANYYRTKTEEVFNKYGSGGGATTGKTGTVDTDGTPLSVRSAPSTTASIVGTLADGAIVTITCQERGDMVTGTFGTTDLWDKVGGGYVSDAFVNTGADGQVAPTCP